MTETTYDVVIVGARCAGAPLAMLLARHGHDVLLVDRASFPSDTMSTHFIQSPGMVRLAQWGLLDDLLATGCPPVTKAYFDIGGEGMDIDIPLHEPFPGLLSPRRYILDKLLVDAAVAAGTQLRTGVLVDSLLRDGERVMGIQGHTSEGAFEAHGRIVVGADGRHSVVAREVDAAFKENVDPITGGYYNYYKHTGVIGTQLFLRDGLVCVMFPTHDDCTCVAIGWPSERFPEIRSDIEGEFNAALESLGERGHTVLACERTERFIGTADLPNYVRKPYGRGWALAGDAAYHKDPVAADGISDAFRSAELLAGALHEILGNGTDETEGLTSYERAHHSFAEKHFEPAITVASFDPSPQERFEAFLQARLLDEEEVVELLGSREEPIPTD